MQGKAKAYPNQVGGDPRCKLFLISELLMCSRGRMDNERLSIPYKYILSKINSETKPCMHLPTLAKWLASLSLSTV